MQGLACCCLKGPFLGLVSSHTGKLGLAQPFPVPSLFLSPIHKCWETRHSFPQGIQPEPSATEPCKPGSPAATASRAMPS